MSTPKVIIAGTHSGVGKTSVSLAIMNGLKSNGFRVQAYKVGPDYIDPSYHELVTGKASHNLDDWMMGGEVVKWLFANTTQNCDVAVIEGVMGLFDGSSSVSDEGSTAKIAKILKAPVILVVDTKSMARSVAAMIKGYQTLDQDVQICGVILNRVASLNHFQLLKESIGHYNRVPVLGGIFRDENIVIPQRHLGLKPASENPEFSRCLGRLEKWTAMYPQEDSSQINLSEIIDIAHRHNSTLDSFSLIDFNSSFIGPRIRIAYAKDQAFHFYYQANLDFLEACGAELVPFSPLEDKRLPENIGGIYFGGGFPEVYARELEENIFMRAEISEAVKEDIPVYAECGGLMYLTQGIKTLEGKIYKMVGLIPGFIEMTTKLVDFGYCESELMKNCFLGKQGERFRGHEFHYSRWDAEGTESIHRVDKKRRQSSRLEGYQQGNLLASYVHCHFCSYPQRARVFVETARVWLENKQKMSITA